MTPLRTLYEQDQLSLKQIAEKLGMPATRVRKQLLRQGVTLRTRAEGAALRPGGSFPRRHSLRRLG